MNSVELLQGKIRCLKCGSKTVGWIARKKKWYCWECGHYMTDDELLVAAQALQESEEELSN